jgi:peptidoglycan/xylan/chitin deacetylase (PgdA/CDA1 family)
MLGILTYHSVDGSGSAISIDEAVFRRHVAWLTSGAARVVPLGDLPTRADGEDAVALTFDDGFANFAARAWPLLREHRLPVTLFVVSDRVGRTNAWGGKDAPGIPTLPLLDWDALARLAEEGVELGAHSRTHPDLRRLPDPALADELEACAAAIAARTGRTPAAFAYPYGLVDHRVVEAVRRRYVVAVTTELRPVRRGDAPHLLPRLDGYYFRAAGRLEAWGSASFRRHLWLRASARRVRRAMAVLGSPT